MWTASKVNGIPHDVRPWAHIPLADLFDLLERKEKERKGEHEPADPPRGDVEKEQPENKGS